MLVIKIFSESKKDFRERKKCEKIRAKRGGPIAVKTRSYGALALPEACLEICLEAWSLCFFACGVRWVKFPCFVILDFGSVLSVGSHGWRQSVDTKVGRSLISPYVMGFPIGSTIWALEARIDVAMAHSSWAWLVLLGAIGKLLLRPQQVVIGDLKDITGTKSPNTTVDKTLDDPQNSLKNKGIVDSGCYRHMTGNKAYLVEYQDYNGGPVAFGGSKGQITGKGKMITRKLDFEDVYFVKELKQFNLFSVSQMCDRKNKVLFTDSECLVLSPDFKLPGENQNSRTGTLLNSVGQKGSRGNTVMPELHNKVELLRGRT
ncbi:hypothetical protein Tco_0673074 [Tanacetum coccineum]